MSDTPVPKKVQLSRDPSPELLKELEWAREVRQKGLTLAGESLKQLVTLNSALLAGTAGFFNQLPMPIWFKAGTLIFLFLSLAVALYAGRPRFASVRNLFDPGELYQQLEKASEERLSLFDLSAFLLVMGFVCTVLGSILHGFGVS
jgi:hypothetical protein